MKDNFIRTTDAKTASRLVELGFDKISEGNGVFTFLNCKKITFADDDLKKLKISYTNMLCI